MTITISFEGHLDDFINAYNFARRLKTLKGLTPYEFICKKWTEEPEKFILNPNHQIPEPNSKRDSAITRAIARRRKSLIQQPPVS